MIRKRLITVLTFNNGILFRTKDFIPDYRYTCNFVDAWSVDEIVVLDVTRPGQGERKNFYSVVSQFAEKCFVPLAAGGKVTGIDDFRTLLAIGADKVTINTEAFRHPQIISDAAQIFGSQCVVVSIDAKKKKDGSYEVYIANGTEPVGMDPVAWARKAAECGAGEILITAMDKDGSLEGYDNDLNSQIAEAVNIPVLVCGGAGKWQDFVDGSEQGKATAVCTTNIYHFTEKSIRSAKIYMKNANINVRL